MKKYFIRIVLLIFSCVCIISAQDSVKPPPASPQPQDVPKRISKGVVNGQAINLPVPEYPAAARAVAAAGSVNVAVVIDEHGSVISADAVSGHPLLRSAAKDAAIQAKFSPTLLAGQPVTVSGVIVYNFQLPTEPETPESNEDVDFIGFTVALRLMTAANSDVRLSSVADAFFEEFGKDFDSEGMPAEFASLKELSKATAQRRTDILDELNARHKQGISKDQVWHAEIAEVLGNLMVESLARVVTGESDLNAYRLNLTKLNDLAASAPGDFPKDVLMKIEDVAKFSKEENLGDEAIMSSLSEKIDIVGDAIME